MNLTKYSPDKFKLCGEPTKPSFVGKKRMIELVSDSIDETSYRIDNNAHRKCNDKMLVEIVKELVEDWIRDKTECEKYCEAVKEYRRKSAEHASELHNQFKQELFEELGIADNPKRELLFSRAWEQGHSAGYDEVYTCACDLVELIR